ncbi:MAG: hypothetical protein ACE37K_15610 [Planctomycetota bacterium]
MNKQRMQRLTRVEGLLRSRPLPHQVVRAAFETFASSGRLPEDDRLAYAVVSRARQGFECVFDDNGMIDWAASIQAAIDARVPRPDPLCDELYNEAVFGDGMVRWGARYALQAFAKSGSDVTRPLFQDWDPEIPDYGSVGLHLLGFPQRLVRPPYEVEATSLLERAARLRERLPVGDQEWAVRLAEAADRWQQQGLLPDDDVLREAALIESGMELLFDNFLGRDVGEAMRELMAASSEATAASTRS